MSYHHVTTIKEVIKLETIRALKVFEGMFACLYVLWICPKCYRKVKYSMHGPLHEHIMYAWCLFIFLIKSLMQLLGLDVEAFDYSQEHLQVPWC
jgi:hypothetical protein